MNRLRFSIYKAMVAISIVATIVLSSSCATYYQKIITFNKNFENQDYESAKAYLDNNPKLGQKRNTAVLYDLNLATVCHLTGDYERSIELFNKADNYYETYSTNWGLEAVALLANPNVTPYKLENFEPVMIHFYQALNYIAINNYDEALVECRRMNEVLNNLSDLFRKLNNARHYSQDAFGHYVMGILYETMNDNNNAFIAYRNAYNIYSTDYAPMYGIEPPYDLKQALIRTAKATGFSSEVSQYEKEFGMTTNPLSSDNGRVVLFVLDNLAPIKDQHSITFTNAGYSAGMLNFTCDYEEFNNIYIPYELDNDSIDRLNIVHITLPRYKSRYPQCLNTAPSMLIDNQFSSINVAENIDQIARQSLHDRIWTELGKSILRVAAKQIASAKIAKQNSGLGALFEIGSAIAERADTRHWQSLPGRVMVVDRQLSPGTHTFEFSSCGKTTTMNINVEAGKTSFAVMASF